QLAAEARLLEAAPLRLGEVRAEVVDPDGAVAQTRCDALRPARVLRPDRTREAVDRVVREYHGLVLGREGLDRDDRAEALVLDDGHAGVRLVEDGGQVVEARLQVAFAPAAAAAQAGALGDAGLDVRRHLVAV